MRTWLLLGILVVGGSSAAYAAPSIDLRWERVASAGGEVPLVMIVENTGPVAVAYESCSMIARIIAPDGRPFSPSQMPAWCDVISDESLAPQRNFTAAAFRFGGDVWRDGRRSEGAPGTYAVEGTFGWSFLGLPHREEARATFSWG